MNTKTNQWKEQIEVKKQVVNRANQTNIVNQVKVQIQKQSAVVEQLRRQVHDLQRNQTEMQQTLTNTEDTLKELQAKQRTAETNVQKINGRLNNTRQAEGLVVRKEQEINVKQAEYAAKQRTALEIKNRLTIVDQDISSATKTKAELQNEKGTQEKRLEMEQKKKEQLDGEHQRLRVQMEIGQQRKQQLTQQKDERKSQLEMHNQTMMQRTAEFDKAQSELNAKAQQQFQLQSQRDNCVHHIQHSRTQTALNEQKLQENQQTIAETLQARREQQMTKQVIIRTMLLACTHLCTF